MFVKPKTKKVTDAPSSPGLDPTLVVGNTQSSQEVLLHEASQVIPIFDLEGSGGETAVHDYVARRIEELSLDRQPPMFGLMDTDEFIAPTTPVYIHRILTRPYFMDDLSAYETAFSSISSYFDHMTQQGLPEEEAYFNGVIQGANHAQAAYFGLNGSLEMRMFITRDVIDLDDDSPGPEDVSIAAFKGKNAAECQERVALAHNVLRIFGVTSRLVTGKLEKTTEDGRTTTEDHAFILIKSPKGAKVLFDPTNPIYYFDTKGNIDTMAATVRRLDLDEDGRQHIEHHIYQLVDDQPQVSSTRQFVYSFSEPID